MPRASQRGFVQNFVIPGIIMLGAVIAGIAWLSRSTQANTSPDEENMQAMVIITQAVQLQAALERATGDGIITHSESGVIDLAATLQQSTFMPRASFPVPPAAALVGPAQWEYAQRHLRTYDAQATPQPVGTSAPDDVIFLVNLTPGVCASLNFKLFGSNTLRNPDGSYATQGRLALNAGTVEGPNGKVPGSQESTTREGCVRNGSTGYAYYKVVGVN